MTAMIEQEIQPFSPVRIKLFKDSGRYSEPLYVSVNTRRYKILRGVEVTVPYCVAKVVEASQMQDETTAAMIDGLVRAYDDQVRKLQQA